MSEEINQQLPGPSNTGFYTMYGVYEKGVDVEVLLTHIQLSKKISIEILCLIRISFTVEVIQKKSWFKIDVFLL